MKTEKEISEELLQRNAELRERLQEALRDNRSLREEAVRQHARADEKQKAWHRTHEAMNVLRKDAMRVLEEHGARPVYSELETEREAHRRLHEKWQRWRQFARQSIEMKALLTQKVRDLEAALEEMRQRASHAEETAQQAASHAQALVNQRDDQLARIRDCARRWNKGKIGALKAITGVLADLDGFPLPDAIDPELERHRELRYAQASSLMNEAADQLAAMERLLDAEGVGRTTTSVQQLKDYIRLQQHRKNPRKEKCDGPAETAW